MQHRTLSIVAGSLLIGAAAGIAFFSQDSLAVERPPGVEALPDEPVAAVVTSADQQGVAGDAVYRPSQDGPATPEVATVGEQRTDTGNWTSGIIRGDIQLAVSVLDKLGPMTVVVEEARNAFDSGGHFERPARIVVAVERGRGTPTFEVTDVPFSEYPYTVAVHAPGLNGGRRTVVCDAKHPLVDDVVLSITPGAPYSILLRDQDGGPHVGVDVNLNPIGEPFGRQRFQGTSDSFGSIVFEGVLAGAYDLSASAQGQQLGKNERVTVQPGVRVTNSKIQGQGYTMTIPRGVALNLLVHDAAGYGIGEARVKATATDRIRLTEVETVTDQVGRAHFPHLQPGVWQVTIECAKFQRVDLQIRLEPDQQPEQRNVKLVRNRR